MAELLLKARPLSISVFKMLLRFFLTFLPSRNLIPKLTLSKFFRNIPKPSRSTIKGTMEYGLLLEEILLFLQPEKMPMKIKSIWHPNLASFLCHKQRELSGQKFSLPAILLKESNKPKLKSPTYQILM